MSLKLYEIYFDHDKLSELRRPPGSNSFNSAFHIRLNQDFEIPWPEYKKGNLGEKPESYVAYSIKDTFGQDVFILVGFENLSPGNSVYEVKAEGGGILGPLSPMQVTFSAGNNKAYACFPLHGRKFEQIGKYDVTWNWLYRKQGEVSWENLGETKHRIFLTYAHPEAPWSREPYFRFSPWVELLDICCEIAQGAKDDIMAAAQITKAINSQYNLRYDIIAGAPRYVYTIDINNRPVSIFDVESWNNRVIRGNAPPDILFLPDTTEEHKHFHIVGCQDTATALAVMASIIGIKAEVAYHTYFGYLKIIEPIGRSKSNNPYAFLNPNQPTSPVKGEDEERTKFQFHYYVKVRNNNFDSCMKEWSENSQNEGWLINLTQAEYEEKAIDRSTPRRKEMNRYQSPDGAWHISAPEHTDLNFLIS